MVESPTAQKVLRRDPQSELLDRTEVCEEALAEGAARRCPRAPDPSTAAGTRTAGQPSDAQAAHLPGAVAC